MARTRTTIRRIDPWSILKFSFVANLVLLAIELLVGAFAWAMIRRLELIETICGLAGQLGVDQCAVDGQQLFDTVLVLGLLGVVIQTGVLVFLSFLANLIFDLVGGIVVTLDDEPLRAPTAGGQISSRSSSTSRKNRMRSLKPKLKPKPKTGASTVAAKKPPSTTPASSSTSSDDTGDSLFGGS